ncbi:MAG: hypothetical protein EOL87_14690 [Spartobacteria bacterium]|nr:hypothetical protein [Spartobacteria bacterium]
MDNQHVKHPLMQSEHNTDSGTNVIIQVPESMTFLGVFHQRIQEVLADSAIELQQVDLQTGKYYVNYHFKRGNETACLHMTFKANGKINPASVIAKATNSEALFTEAANLAHHAAQCRPEELTEITVAPLNPLSVDDIKIKLPGFMHAFFDEISGLLGSTISVYNVHCRKWCCTFEFMQDERLAAFDVYYNGKQQITRCIPLASPRYSDELARSVEGILGI